MQQKIRTEKKNALNKWFKINHFVIVTSQFSHEEGEGKKEDSVMKYQDIYARKNE